MVNARRNPRTEASGQDSRRSLRLSQNHENPKGLVTKKKIEEDDDEDEEVYVPKKSGAVKKIDIDELDEDVGSDIQINASKPIAELKKGDKVKVDSLTLEVDTHEVMIDHGATKEMSIDLFDPKTDKDYQIRYFVDQVERSLEVYRLEEILYDRMDVKRVEW